MLQLSIQDYEGKNTLIPLTDGELTIGRDEGNAICLTERNVSRNHARIIANNGTVMVESVAATYGTRFNSLILRERQQFTASDVVQIGDYVLELVGASGKPAPRDTALVDDQAASPPTSPPVENATAIVNLADIQSAINPTGDATAIGEAEQPRLVVESENLRGLEFRVTRTPLVLGRVSETSDLVVDHRSISKEHARLTRRGDGTWELLDLGSANGIKVNGEPYSKSLLRSGDRLTLGHVTLRFLAAGAAAPSIQAPPGKSGGKGVLVALLAVIVLLAGAAVAFLVLRNKKPDTRPAPSAVGEAPTGEVGGEPEAKEAKAKPALGQDTGKETLDKIRKLRAKGMLQVALDAARAYQQEHPGDPAIGLMVEQLGKEVKLSATLDGLEGKLGKEPDTVYQESRAIIEQLDKESPLHEPAKALQTRAAGKAVAGALFKAERALKRRQCDKAQALAEVALEMAPGNTDANRVLLAAQKDCERRPERAPERKVRPAERKPKPKAEPAVVKPKPKPAPPKPKPPQAAKMTGKGYYKAGRAAVLAGDKKKAVGLFKQAVSNGYGRAHGKLASIYFQLGNKGACAKHGRAYLNRYPDAGDAPSIEGLLEKCK